LSRVWKILIGLVVAIVVLLAINTLVVDGETKDAEVTVDGGRILTLPGGDVQVTDTGEPASARAGAPIVLIHCFGCSLRWWDSMVPPLARDHRVIRIDLLGHGGSAKPKSGYSISDQGALVAAALDRLGVQGAVVVGHSLGGDVAVSVAEQASELVDRVVIIDEAPDPSFGELDFLAKLSMTPVIGEALWRLKTDSLVKKGYEQAFAPGYDQADGFDDPDQTARDNEAMTYTSYTDSADASEDYEDESPLDGRMRTTAVPLMVIFGAEDQIYDDVDAALAAYDDVPGVRTAKVRGAGHSPNVEKPVQTARLISEFAADADDASIEHPPRNVGRKPQGGGGNSN
jgi:pimeloyl-ACP methyl ester carboxylesterase